MVRTKVMICWLFFCNYVFLSMAHSIGNFGLFDPSDTISKLPLEMDRLQYHGTTTLAIKFNNNKDVLIAVDSRASLGSYVGSKTVKKVFPITKFILGTMAGGAADCTYWIRRVAAEVNALENEDSDKTEIQVGTVAKLLSKYLRQYKGSDISVGTMISGWDERSQCTSLYYVDSDGVCVEGDSFCVGSGAKLAYSIIDDYEETFPKMSLDEAVKITIMAIRHAAHRDGYSGGYINIIHVNSTGIHHIKRVDAKEIKIN